MIKGEEKVGWRTIMVVRLGVEFSRPSEREYRFSFEFRFWYRRFLSRMTEFS